MIWKHLFQKKSLQKSILFFIFCNIHYHNSFNIWNMYIYNNYIKISDITWMKILIFQKKYFRTWNLHLQKQQYFLSKKANNPQLAVCRGRKVCRGQSHWPLVKPKEHHTQNYRTPFIGEIVSNNNISSKRQRKGLLKLAFVNI